MAVVQVPPMGQGPVPLHAGAHNMSSVESAPHTRSGLPQSGVAEQRAPITRAASSYGG